jgi:hypothetical protein
MRVRRPVVEERGYPWTVIGRQPCGIAVYGLHTVPTCTAASRLPPYMLHKSVSAVSLVLGAAAAGCWCTWAATVSLPTPTARRGCVTCVLC